jgi:nitric oxide reductase subunit B
MVGSWNMLVYDCSMYIMEKLSGDEKMFRKKLPLFFYFLGLVNLMFNWGHHTYILPAAGWIKIIAYSISMTELLILGYIIWKFRINFKNSIATYNNTIYRLLSNADAWIFINLSLAILISAPGINFYTHGTHITVADAMGATIGINSMLLFVVVFYILKTEKKHAFEKFRRSSNAGILISNDSLFAFWVLLIGMGAIKITGKLEQKTFYEIMNRSEPWFSIFEIAGIILMFGITLLILTTLKIIRFKQNKEVMIHEIKKMHLESSTAQELNFRF